MARTPPLTLYLAAAITILTLMYKLSDNLTMKPTFHFTTRGRARMLTMQQQQQQEKEAGEDDDIPLKKQPIILITIGTRPEAIKMAPLYHEFHRIGITPFVVMTGQHHDLIESLLIELEVIIDIRLATTFQHHSKQSIPLSQLMANIIASSSEMITLLQPDLVLVQGDTTSAYAVALASFLLHVDVGHVEAGLRTYDLKSPFPEEMNRRHISTIARFHFAPTLKAVNALKQENVDPNNIFHTGNTAIDGILRATQQTTQTTSQTILKQLHSHPFVYNLFNEAVPEPFDRGNVTAPRIILMTTHRRESHDGGHGRMLQAALRLCDMYKQLHFVVPLHPNPTVQREVLDELLLPKNNKNNIHVIPPTSYLLTARLQKKSVLIMTDSGGLQEEASALQRPVLVLREKSERMESVDAGIAQVVGTTSVDRIVDAASLLLQNIDGKYDKMSTPTFPYGNGTAAKQIVAIVRERYQRGCGDGEEGEGEGEVCKEMEEFTQS